MQPILQYCSKSISNSASAVSLLATELHAGDSMLQGLCNQVASR